MDKYEEMGRAMCVHKKIDPDGTGYTTNPVLIEAIGSSYPLWKYQAYEIEIIIALNSKYKE